MQSEAAAAGGVVSIRALGVGVGGYVSYSSDGLQSNSSVAARTDSGKIVFRHCPRGSTVVAMTMGGKDSTCL
ncbi:hypothetical protein GOBAR_AA17307 [Gossypium barbadense]|uniref:Uncharacterized protein n=1 Tax=Gossypium barbadense TaxID=3634 RepID=A0A2P5XJ52_GOSBA|nr:hypothetical protein GOBAR_AA17307 [Gossypium barbadense]